MEGGNLVIENNSIQFGSNIYLLYILYIYIYFFFHSSYQIISHPTQSRALIYCVQDRTSGARFINLRPDGLSMRDADTWKKTITRCRSDCSPAGYGSKNITYCRKQRARIN